MRKPVPYIAALKIWLAGVLLGPLLLGLGMIINELYTRGSSTIIPDGSVFMLYLLMILYGGFFSLPSALALWLVIALQYRFNQSENVFWPTILSATFLLTTAPFFIILRDLDDFGFVAAYLGAIWLGVFWTFYRLKTFPEHEPDEPLDANL
ncbi:MAG: hypothetical protein L6Q97_16045 [Thermoanaerobaculia bacterium]|nr:hypothetical protein [Thermoanaerobaculia bacterium]